MVPSSSRSARWGTALLAVVLGMVAACSGDDGGRSSESGPTSSSTEVRLDPGAIVDDALLTTGDLPPGWRDLAVDAPAELDETCPELGAELTDVESQSLVAQGSFAARAPELDLPAVRHRVSLLAGSSSVEVFDLLSSGELALCAAAAALGGSDFDGSGLREVDPGTLGDEATSRVATFEFTESGVTIGGRFERVTYRVGPIVGVVLLTSSPAFPLSAGDRSDILEAAASRARSALAE